MKLDPSAPEEQLCIHFPAKSGVHPGGNTNIRRRHAKFTSRALVIKTHRQEFIEGGEIDEMSSNLWS